MLSLVVLGWEGYNLILINDICNKWDGNPFSNMVIRKSGRMLVVVCCCKLGKCFWLKVINGAMGLC